MQIIKNQNYKNEKGKRKERKEEGWSKEVR
jgi:hypothetical protein